MIKEYRIKINNELITLNSQKEYNELKKQYTNYEIMVNKTTKEITFKEKTVKPLTESKPPKWFLDFANMVIERLDRIEARLDRHEEILLRHEEILLRHDAIFKHNNLK